VSVTADSTWVLQAAMRTRCREEGIVRAAAAGEEGEAAGGGRGEEAKGAARKVLSLLALLVQKCKF
jgi:hypothetical protein